MMKLECPVCSKKLNGDASMFVHPKTDCPLSHCVFYESEWAAVQRTLEIERRRSYEQAREQAVILCLQGAILADRDGDLSARRAATMCHDQIRAMQPPAKS